MKKRHNKPPMTEAALHLDRLKRALRVCQRWKGKTARARSNNQEAIDNLKKEIDETMQTMRERDAQKGFCES